MKKSQYAETQIVKILKEVERVDFFLKKFVGNMAFLMQTITTGKPTNDYMITWASLRKIYHICCNPLWHWLPLLPRNVAPK